MFNHPLLKSIKIVTIFAFRRQTAEEREQERQAATKYFLSMQFGAAAAAAAAAPGAAAAVSPLAPPLPPLPPGMALPPQPTPTAPLTPQGFHDVRNSNSHQITFQPLFCDFKLFTMTRFLLRLTWRSFTPQEVLMPDRSMLWRV